MLDRGPNHASRWEKWRPTVSLCQQEDLLIERFELLMTENSTPLADRVIQDIHQVSPHTKVCPHLLNVSDPWDFEEMYNALLDFSLSYPFKPEKEDYKIHLTTGTHVAQICMFLLTEARYFPAQIIQSSPPIDRNLSPGQFSIIDLDLSKYDSIAQRFHTQHLESTSFLKSGINTQNSNFNHMIEQIEQVAIQSNEPLLLTGPSGSGKSQLAQRIYELKKQRHQMMGPFQSIQCAALPHDSVLTAFLGYKKNAFPLASTSRTGHFACTHNGMLVLDEIDALGLEAQAMLVKVLEEKQYYPIGSEKPMRCDFQLIATTSTDLAQSVQKGQFRRDLWVRISTWTYALPSLKDRKEDFEPNIHYELSKYSNAHGKKSTFNKEAYQKYLNFCLSDLALWSSNFRDLTASIYRLCTLAPGGRIRTPEVQMEIERLQYFWNNTILDTKQDILASVLSKNEIDTLDLFDQIQLAGVIAVCQQENTLSAAGRKLFSNTRTKKKMANDADRLSKFLQRFNLSWQTIKNSVKD